MPNPSCPRCGGSGWIVTERDGMSGAERCGCADPAAPDLAEKANLPPLYRDASFDNFTTAHLHEPQKGQMQHVMLTVKKYANEYPLAPKPGLLLIGEPGVGKTHLAVAALRMLLSRGHNGVFFDYMELLQQIKRSYNELSGSSDKEALQQALESEILLLDDLGTHRVSDWTLDTITEIITHRCNHQKAVIATTNLPDPDAGQQVMERDSSRPGGYSMRTTLSERIGIRARSRLFEMCRVVVLPAVDDYRVRRLR